MRFGTPSSATSGLRKVNFFSLGIALAERLLSWLRPDLAGGVWATLSTPLGLVLAAGIAVFAVRAGVQMAANSVDQGVESLVGRLSRPEE